MSGAQSKDGLVSYNESRFEGAAWKESMDLLGVSGGYQQVPRGNGGLFVELRKGFGLFHFIAHC